MMKDKAGIFDTHAHYTDTRFSSGSECPGGADALIEKLSDDGVSGILNVSVSIRNSLETVRQAARHARMFAAVGIHPTEIYTDGMCVDEAMCALDAMLRERVRDKIVAVGEIGLDYYWKPYDKKSQADFFEAQLQLAARYNLPVSVHDREAHGDVFEIILRHPEVRGVLHAYSGSAELAHELVRRGWFIAFGGVVTFKNAARVRAVAQTVPLDRLLLETDCPYLAPEPFRGKLNHSGLIAYTARMLGELHGVDSDEIIGQCRENTRALFGV